MGADPAVGAYVGAIFVATVRGNAPAAAAGRVAALALHAERTGGPAVVHVELSGSYVLVRRENGVVLALFKEPSPPVA